MSKKPSLFEQKAKEAKDKASLLGDKVKESGLDEKAKDAKDKASLFGNKAKESIKGSKLFNKNKSD